MCNNSLRYSHFNYGYGVYKLNGVVLSRTDLQRSYNGLDSVVFEVSSLGCLLKSIEFHCIEVSGKTDSSLLKR